MLVIHQVFSLLHSSTFQLLANVLLSIITINQSMYIRITFCRLETVYKCSYYDLKPVMEVLPLSGTVTHVLFLRPPPRFKILDINNMLIVKPVHRPQLNRRNQTALFIVHCEGVDIRVKSSQQSREAHR